MNDYDDYLERQREEAFREAMLETSARRIASPSRSPTASRSARRPVVRGVDLHPPVRLPALRHGQAQLVLLLRRRRPVRRLGLGGRLSLFMACALRLTVLLYAATWQAGAETAGPDR